MDEAAGFVLDAMLIGTGATATMDLWSVLRKMWFGVPMPDYGMVGRWLAYLPRGRFRHDPIAATAPVRGEAAIGWISHYLIGMVLAALLLFSVGPDWVSAPTAGAALLAGACTVAAPYFILQPGMGLGIAARRARNPATARLHSLVTHLVFGFGLYLTAQARVVTTGWL
jgi:hypothetical protein